MIFFLAILLGLIINYFTGGIDFNTSLCFFVGLFLIMPILLKIHFKDLKEIFSFKKILLIDILLNFVLIPLLAFVVGYLFFGIDNYPFIVAMVLLALLPGGGLLMTWLSNTKSNMHVGFILFSINLFLFSGFFILFSFGVDYFVSKYEHNKTSISNKTQIVPKVNLNPQNQIGIYSPINITKQQEKKEKGCAISETAAKLGLSAPSCFQDNKTSIYGLFGFVALVLIPFLVSRIILFFIKNPKSKIFKYAPKLSKLSAFILISYIFSLTYIRTLFNVDIYLILKVSLAVMLFYVGLYFLITVVLKTINIKEDISKSLFWNSFTRFITLSLILSFLYAIALKKTEIILIPIVAYFFQIIFASFLARKK